MKGGKLHPMPEGLTGLIPSQFGPMLRTPLVSPLGKLRMGLDYLIPARKGDADESLGSFVCRRLGRDVYEHLIEPLMAGIYSGNGDELSLQATFPQLRAAEREHGGLVKGVLAQKKAQQARPIGHQAPIGFLSFYNGIQELVDALEQQIRSAGGEIHLNTPVTALARVGGDRWAFTTPAGVVDVDSIVLAAPVHVQADLLAGIAPEAAAAMRDIPQVSSAVVMLGYEETAGNKAPASYGYLSPRAENRPVKAITWMSSKWEGRAPEGHFLVRGFLGRAGDEQVLNATDDELVRMVRDEIAGSAAIHGEPMLTRVVRLNAASPQYTLGHLDRVAQIDQAVAGIPGLAIAGNMLRGVGIPDAIAAGETASARVLT
jgi:oxygen-dependent protoporphyrinogen oxidase